MKRPAFPVDVSKMKMQNLWLVAIAAVLCGCAGEKSEVIHQQPPTSPSGVFTALPPTMQNSVRPGPGMAEIAVISGEAAIKATGIKLAIETSNSTYRVRMNPGTNIVEYDKISFQAPTPGLCPAGAFAYVKNDRDAYLGCGQKEYSSANMSSQISLSPDYTSLSGTNDFVSGPWEISQILGGINLCAEVDSIRKIKLGFLVGLRVNGVERRYVAETDWSTASPELIKALK